MSDLIPTSIIDVNGRPTIVHRAPNKSKKAQARQKNRLDSIKSKLVPGYYTEPQEVDAAFAHKLFDRLGFSKSLTRTALGREHEGFLLDGLYNQLHSVDRWISDFARSSKEQYESHVIDSIVRDLQPMMEKMDKLGVSHSRRIQHVYIAVSTLPRTSLLKDYPVEEAERALQDSATGMVQVRKAGFGFDTIKTLNDNGIDLDLAIKLQEGTE